jgi:hypothetical protein
MPQFVSMRRFRTVRPLQVPLPKRRQDRVLVVTFAKARSHEPALCHCATKPSSDEARYAVKTGDGFVCSKTRKTTRAVVIGQAQDISLEVSSFNLKPLLRGQIGTQVSEHSGGACFRALFCRCWPGMQSFQIPGF